VPRKSWDDAASSVALHKAPRRRPHPTRFFHFPKSVPFSFDKSVYKEDDLLSDENPTSGLLYLVLTIRGRMQHKRWLWGIRSCLLNENVT
jgi:hypothetical protein